MSELVRQWRTAVRDAGATAPAEAVGRAGARLLERWAEPHRHYHDGAHLSAVLDVVDRHADLAARPAHVRLAAWWHDAVYDPRAPGDANERASAELAVRELTDLGVPPAVGAEVARLVLLTVGHRTGDDDPDGALLCDADLAVLAGEPVRYAAYTAAVRREYGHVPDVAFRVGRAAVLRALLDLPVIYRSAPLRVAWEVRARANLTAELAALT